MIQAHKATGDYAYVGVVREIAAATSRFRVLALSATPGTEPKKVQDVLDNLKIHRIEVHYITLHYNLKIHRIEVCVHGCDLLVFTTGGSKEEKERTRSIRVRSLNGTS